MEPDGVRVEADAATELGGVELAGRPQLLDDRGAAVVRERAVERRRSGIGGIDDHDLSIPSLPSHKVGVNRGFP